MDHPIGQLMQTTLENIKDMVDVNTVVGEPIEAGNGSTIIPISKVSFGFVAGGGEYGQGCREQEEAKRLPFAGGTGAGVTVQPLGFLVSSQDSIRMLPAQVYAPTDRMIELVPQLMCEVKNMLKLKNEQTAAKMTPPMNVPQN